MNTSKLPQDLMTNSLLYFEKGVPIDDLALRNDQKRRLTRVSHVYWQWLRNPFSVDYKALLRQLVKGLFADPPAEYRAAQKDIQLFEYIKEAVSPMSRKEAQIKVTAAAEKMLHIGMETDNIQALDKGSRRLYEVAGLDKPEDNSADINKVSFLPSVVVTNIKEVDDTKESYSDDEVRRIAEKYGAYIDPKREMVEDKVATMEARSGIGADGDKNEQNKEDDNEQDRHRS